MPTSSNDFQNDLFKSTMGIFQTLSLYSPIIICVSIIVFSMFTSKIEKAFVFFMWIFVITFLRIIVFRGFSPTPTSSQQIHSDCKKGVSEIFVLNDFTYSTYILTFTMMYFVTPMILVSSQSKTNVMNYGILAFFIAYISLDLYIKQHLSCVTSLFSKHVVGDILSGSSLGGLISGIIMYGSTLKGYLYINEMNSNKEVCSMPSKQQFKCKVYKDGTLIGDI